MKQFFFLCLLSFAGQTAGAFRLDPMVAEFEPGGTNQSKVFRVENNGQDRIAVQLKVTSRSVDSKGQESREAVSDFSIYPEQISLGPNDSRNVRVTYKGAKDLKAEKAYRLIASQLPVEFKGDAKKKTQLNFLFEYVASVYVQPAGVHAKLEIQKVERTDDHNIRLIIENKGTAHRLLKGVSVAVKTEAGKTVNFKPDAFQSWPGENLLAGAVREFDLPTVDPIPEKTPLKASLQISEQL